MYLKALEIQGFKSFPEKTVLNFGEDITAIVGPNGSGKSNISDAIRWVMGEQNSRQLRGAKMEDVIFGGTEKRNQMGFAQVTLVIDNTEHIFPGREELEVAVTRRYYRSGESEYYINKQSVRLKDVNELFMDTGMGREGYSIIGQGKVDEILSAKSGERREVFEEAAGISKFRHRKEDAERKLERTQENLVRINDKIAELELQVEPLRKQSEVAKQYLLLRDELRVLEISVWLENLQVLKADKLKLETDAETARRDREAAEQQLNDAYTEAEAISEQVRQNDMAAEAMRAESSSIESAAAEKERAMAVLRTTVMHSEENMARLQEEIDAAENRREELQSRLTALLARTHEIDTELEALSREAERLLGEMQAIKDTAEGADQTAEGLRAEEALALREAADGRADLSALRSAITEVQQRSDDMSRELEEDLERLAQAEQESRENKKLLREAQEQAQAEENIINGHTMRMDSRRQKAENAAQEKLELTMKVQGAEDRVRMLTEMEKEYDGFHKAVKVCMQASERGGLHGIHGPVASLMRTNEKYTVALEIALGAGLQNVVVDREEDGKAAMNFLRQRDSGRATFLPMTAVHGDLLRENVREEYGFLGIASELVEYNRKYDDIFKYLLGRTVVVEDIDCGIAMARKFKNAFRIVTLDGQVLNRGGSMTGGSISRSAGVLSRANELEKLKKALTLMQDKLLEATQRAEGAKLEWDKAQYELDVAKEQQKKAMELVLQYQGKQDHYDILIDTLRRACEDKKAGLAAFAGRIAQDEKACAAAQHRISLAEERAASARRQADESQVGQSALLEKVNELSQQLSECRARQASFETERSEKLHSVEDTRLRQVELSTDRAGREAQLTEYKDKINDAQTQLNLCESQAGALHEQGIQLRERLATLSAKKLTLEGKRDAKQRWSREQNEIVRKMAQEVSRLEQKLEAAAMQEAQILDKLWENYELSHSDAMAQRVELESMAKASRRIAELNREIKSLGTPNIGAIEEFDRVNTRYTYLSEQRSDVERAKEELQGVIDEITRQMTDIFAEQFKLLNESFQETFLELFGGGKACLELEDENDILGCGIEIKVQPPGKQLKTITLLSGGEKAFVAIALYFAILKVHPTPFCVMDEIEAALDEANVVRTARYMRRIAGKTQFIVITHRRGTMEEADVLYGVTMQERGVSRILTINMNDMAKELNIK